MLPDDVPSRIDFRNMADARRWADAAMLVRPARHNVFDRIVQELRDLRSRPLSVLELGSGPGFLVERITVNLPTFAYTALDFSAAMHALARERLGANAERVCFVEGDFKQPHWTSVLTTFDAVVTMQAVHELRHKRHAPALYRQVGSVLHPGGSFLMCDHYVGDGAMSDRALFMTMEEHEAALHGAGFTNVHVLLKTAGLVLYRGDLPEVGRYAGNVEHRQRSAAAELYRQDLLYGTSARIPCP
jgi:SAM-dependent methyltransferase